MARSIVFVAATCFLCCAVVILSGVIASFVFSVVPALNIFAEDDSSAASGDDSSADASPPVAARRGGSDGGDPATQCSLPIVPCAASIGEWPEPRRTGAFMQSPTLLLCPSPLTVQGTAPDTRDAVLVRAFALRRKQSPTVAAVFDDALRRCTGALDVAAIRSSLAAISSSAADASAARAAVVAWMQRMRALPDAWLGIATDVLDALTPDQWLDLAAAQVAVALSGSDADDCSSIAGAVLAPYTDCAYVDLVDGAALSAVVSRLAVGVNDIVIATGAACAAGAADTMHAAALDAQAQPWTLYALAMRAAALAVAPDTWQPDRRPALIAAHRTGATATNGKPQVAITPAAGVVLGALGGVGDELLRFLIARAREPGEDTLGALQKTPLTGGERLRAFVTVLPCDDPGEMRRLVRVFQ